ncbi:MAG: RluA family pseudouridine synthase, partial [Niabella sp.]
MLLTLQPMNEDEKYIEQTDSNDELYQKFVYKTDTGQEPYRIDKFLMNRIEGATRNKIQQAIHNKMVLVNGNEIKPNFKVKANQEIVVYTDTAPEENEILPENIPLNIFYEDDQIIIVNKAPGMVVHPGSGNYDGTLLNGIAWHLQQQNTSINIETLPRFGLVHRIDKNTSGLLVLAKTEGAMRHLAKQFFDHTVDRKYIALVWGDVEADEGTIIAHVGRNLRFRKLFEA